LLKYSYRVKNKLLDKNKNQNKMPLLKNQANCFNLERVGWKYYNTIRKKAVEQEFSWSGLTISLSIAFFIVFVGATILHLTYVSIIY